MKLYEFSFTRSIRARWTLQELGVDFESVKVNLFAGEARKPAFLEINPAGKLPALADVAEKHMQGRTFVAGDSVTVADFVLAYTLDWASEVQLLDRSAQLVAYMERMYARPKAPKRIAQIRAAM